MTHKKSRLWRAVAGMGLSMSIAKTWCPPVTKHPATPASSDAISHHIIIFWAFLNVFNAIDSGGSLPRRRNLNYLPTHMRWGPQIRNTYFIAMKLLQNHMLISWSNHQVGQINNVIDSFFSIKFYCYRYVVLFKAHNPCSGEEPFLRVYKKSLLQSPTIFLTPAFWT
jgi:hypothetical protein